MFNYICEICGEPFSRNERGKRFCSLNCKNANQKLINLEKRKLNHDTLFKPRICHGCGITFEVSIHLIKQNNQKGYDNFYCSQECSRKHGQTKFWSSEKGYKLAFERAKKRFYETIIKSDDPNECWGWKGHDIYGYAGMVVKGKSYKASRFSYEIHKGEIPEGLVVRHLCNNPICTNPEHLEVGTYKENSQDMVKSDRSLVGSKNAKAKIDEKTAAYIKYRFFVEKAITMSSIAKELNITKKIVEDICNNRSWKHVPIPDEKPNI